MNDISVQGEQASKMYRILFLIDVSAADTSTDTNHLVNVIIKDWIRCVTQVEVSQADRGNGSKLQQHQIAVCFSLFDFRAYLTLP